ncbi:GNAT family N-acetyltransferase [Nakamurella lactea]|uniref:GNAT family N-acetyltransferase n=1 Tax=Nakamurella lactea TaxID=459515 RepID=UPI00041B438D|nr:GNAT family N-acetyltransferase [Nakamurella lactea]
MTSATHPLAELLVAAEAGRFPAADGGWHRLPQWRPGLQAIVAFTGHAVLVADRFDAGRLEQLGFDGVGGAHDPRVISELAGPDGWIDSLDGLLVRRGAGGPPRLVPRPDLADHPRVTFSRAVRDGVRVWGYPDPGSRSLVAVSTGIAGLTEIGFELDPGVRGSGAGTRLVADALTVIPRESVVLAAVAPGNAASLRVLVRSGFRPVASVQLFRPKPAVSDGANCRPPTHR